MANDSLETNCDCPMECDSISYFSYYVSTIFNPEEMCRRQQKGLMEDIFENKFPPQFVRILRKFTRNETFKEREYCMKYLQYKAEVTFQLATNTMSVTVISRRLSFFDKLSGFGKSIMRKLQFNSILYFFRWHFRAVYWNQYSQHG